MHLRRSAETWPASQAVAGIALCVSVHEPGVHATIAGVVLASFLPICPGQHDGDAGQANRR